MRFTLALTVASHVVLSQSCKPKASSSLSDLATETSFKSGVYSPLLDDEVSAANLKPYTVSQFMKLAEKLTDKTLRLVGNRAYAVTTNGEGEQLLIMRSGKDEPVPVMSIKGGQLFRWGAQLYQSSEKETLVTDLFLKYSYNGVPKTEVDKMYVRRRVLTHLGTREIVMVPWTGHVRSETAQAIVYRIGNSIMNASTGKPAMEYRRVPNEPAWVVIGPYKDKDIHGGTVFWKVDDGFYSTSPGSEQVTVWKRQDYDSLDRVKSVAKSSVKVPTVVEQVLAAVPQAGASNDPAKTKPAGYNVDVGDRFVFDFSRIGGTVAGTTITGSSLALTSALKEKASFTESDYKSEGLGLWTLNPFTYMFSPSEKHDPKFTTNEAQGGNMTYKAINYTDPAGGSHGGVLVNSWGSDSEDQTRQIWNRTTGEVNTVDAEGKTLSTQSYAQWKQATKATVENADFRYGAGGDAQAQAANAMKQRAEGDKIVQSELQKSKDLSPNIDQGAGASGATMLGQMGIDSAKVELDSRMGGGQGANPLQKAVTGNTADALKKGLTGELPSVADVTSGTVVNGLKDSADFLANGRDVPGGKPVEYVLGGGDAKNKAIGQNISAGIGGAVDMANTTYQRSGDGLDYLDGVRIAGTGVEAAWKNTAGVAAQTLTGSDGAGEFVGQAPGKLFDTAESLARSSNARITSEQSGEALAEIANQNSRIINSRETVNNQMNTLDALAQNDGVLSNPTTSDGSQTQQSQEVETTAAPEPQDFSSGGDF